MVVQAYCWVVLVLVLVNLIQALIIWEVGISIKKMARLDNYL